MALESTLISHGLPYPQNVEVARASEAAVRAGAPSPPPSPSTTGVSSSAWPTPTSKPWRPPLPARSARSPGRASLPRSPAGGWAATTVGATMIAAHAAGISVFATGGIGGVHRGAIGGPAAALDISSDLEELARTPMAVVCAGPKAILDVALTLEYLETHGVPVVAVGQADLPGFYSRSSGIPAPSWAPDEAATAESCGPTSASGWARPSSCARPCPLADALPEADAREAIERAIAEAEAAAVAGPALTPVAARPDRRAHDGASVRANTALIVHDAEVAGRLAVALAGGSRNATRE